MFVIVLAATAVAVKVVTAVHRFTPSNLVIRRVLTRAGYRWALPVGAAGILAHGAIALLAGILAGQGGPGAWHLLVILGLYNAVRFAVLIPVATLRLLSARWRERPPPGRPPLVDLGLLLAVGRIDPGRAWPARRIRAAYGTGLDGRSRKPYV